MSDSTIGNRKSAFGSAPPRPRVAIPLTTFDVALEIIGAGVLVGSITWLMMTWPSIPERVPHHFDYAGNVDAWGSKSGMLILPCLGAVLYIGLAAISRIPHFFNYPVRITEDNAPREYAIAVSMLRWMRVEMALLFARLEYVFVSTAKGSPSMGTWDLFAMIGVLLATIAWHVWKMRAAR